MPGKDDPTYQEKFEAYKKEKESERHLFTLENGTLSNIEVDPVILKEVIYPENPPNEKTIMHIEAAFSAYNEGRIIFALKNLDEAKEEWTNSGHEINTLDFLFFEFMKGSIFESSCRDDFALSNYNKCLSISNQLEPGHPDRALPFMGFGSVLYNSGEYALSARCYIKAQQIRESTLGPDTADVAACYNNLACCYIKLDRTIEAFKLLKLAEAVFQSELGTFHERTLTVLFE
jgi:tetratricopeptide (TPR) repeat protein